MFESIFTLEDDLKSGNEDFEREENLFLAENGTWSKLMSSYER